MEKSIIMTCLLCMAVIACYSQPYTLDVTISALYKTSTVTLDPPGGVYDVPSMVTLTAIPGGGGVQEFFGGWAGDLDGSDNPAIIYVDGPKSVTAYFLHNDPPSPTPDVSPPPPEYKLNVIISGTIFGSTVTIDPPGPEYAEPTTVTLTANCRGSELLYMWGGDLSGNDNPATIYVDGEKTVYAQFIHGDPPPVGIWFEPNPLQLKVGLTKDTSILCNSGDQNLAAYGFIITFDPAIVSVNTAQYSNGVRAGADGFISALNTTIPGKLTVAGFDVTGKGPGSRLHVLDIAWEGVADGTTTLDLYIESITDSGTNSLGIRQGIDGTIIVTSCLLPGDVNGDRQVNIVDALLIARDFVGLNPPNFDRSCADVDCNGIITILDALLIAQYYVNIIYGFCL